MRQEGIHNPSHAMPSNLFVDHLNLQNVNLVKDRCDSCKHGFVTLAIIHVDLQQVDPALPRLQFKFGMCQTRVTLQMVDSLVPLENSPKRISKNKRWPDPDSNTKPTHCCFHSASEQLILLGCDGVQKATWVSFLCFVFLVFSSSFWGGTSWWSLLTSTGNLSI